MSILHANPTVFLLVRHAQTLWNEEHRHSGCTEVPLSDKAERQIMRLTRKLKSYPITAIYSSPLSRCQATAGPLAEVLSLPITVNESLLERHLGSWEGRSPEDLAPTHPGYHFPDSAYTGQFHIPGAETLEDLEHRLRVFLNSVHSKHPGETVVLATHSGVIWTIIHRLVSNPPAEFFWPSNCSVTTVQSLGNHFTFTNFEKY